MFFVLRVSCFIGFMCGINVLDKDGIFVVMVLFELVIYLYGSNIILYNKLDEIYKTFVLMIVLWLFVKFLKIFVLIVIGVL